MSNINENAKQKYIYNERKVVNMHATKYDYQFGKNSHRDEAQIENCS
jgi:hypothetical protein